jgi:hypothetical protein
MEYRQIQVERERDEVLRQHAIQREQDVFTEELEMDRLRRLAAIEGAEFEDVRTAATTQVEQRGSASAAARKVADRQVAEAGITPEEVYKIRKAVVDGWMEAVERNHIDYTVRLDLVHGRDKVAQDERARLRRELRYLEAYHVLATERADELEKTAARLAKTAEG